MNDTFIVYPNGSGHPITLRLDTVESYWHAREGTEVRLTSGERRTLHGVTTDELDQVLADRGAVIAVMPSARALAPDDDAAGRQVLR